MEQRRSKKQKRIKYDGEINLAVANNRMAKRWKNKTLRWSEFLQMLDNPIETHETPEEYQKMSKSQKDQIKDVGGFVGGFLKEGRRKRGNATMRSLITLDADSTSSDLWDTVSFIFGKAVAIYTTHSHTQKTPRYRLIFPLSRPVTADEYEPIARKLADLVGMDNFDDTTYQAERMMYNPSHSREGVYFFDYIDSPWLNPDDILAEYEDWRDASFWPESSRGYSIRERQAKKAGDPLTKKGVIGAFCRVYDIQGVIEKYLSEVYEPSSHNDRYTYIEGSTEGGLIIYEDKFAYSHHGTDPVGDKLVNAFDLVRVHLFGYLDEEAKPDTPISRLPSYKAMIEKAREDPIVKSELIAEMFDSLEDDFGSLDDTEDDWGDDWESDATEKTKEWLSMLRLTEKNELQRSIYNGFLFLEHDPVLKGCLRFNDFTQQKERAKKLPWSDSKESVWTDNDTTMLRAFLDEKRQLQIKENNLYASILQSAYERRYHPVKEYIEREEWDGVERVETLFIDYLGVEDSEYSRAVTRKWMAGAIARIYQPGIKFEMVPVLSGSQGIGKSTTINKLAPDYFSDSLKGLGVSKDDLQFLVGSWLIELGELSAMKKTEVEKTKQFISATEDRFRPPYGRETQSFPRTCVFIGTSNDDQYLKDKTGNRRFYPLTCSRGRQKASPFDGSLETIVSQLWAEAKHYYDQGEKLYLSEKLESVAIQKQKAAEMEDIAEVIVYEYLDIKIPPDWYERDIPDKQRYIQDILNNREHITVDFDSTKLEPRMLVTSKEILSEAFDKDVNFSLDFRSSSEVRKIGLIMNNHPGWRRKTIRLPNGTKTHRGYKRL
ncbi:VapE domain-containing protein [Enterococcus sp. AZ196]|uniref:VapE domain-containing protein n=1 Tax=Enterococcus sp. AZ196 TaxID=2774659 RepID=UPI003D2756DB